MSGHQPFSELVAKMSPAAQEKIKRGTAEILAEMELGELREALNVTQKTLADRLHTTQAAISKLEKGGNPGVRTLANYLGKIGATLEVNAVIGERRIKLVHLLMKERERLKPYAVKEKIKTAKAPRRVRAATA